MSKLHRLSALALATVLAACAAAPAFAQTVYQGGSGPVVDVSVTQRYNGAAATQEAPVVISSNTAGIPDGSSALLAVKSFRQTCTTSAVQMPSNFFANGVTISIVSGAGVAYFGPAGVTTSTGFPISTNGSVPLAALSYGVANSNQLYLICSDAATTVAVTGN